MLDIRSYYGAGNANSVLKYPSNHPRKKGIDLRLGLMIARDFQPFNIVNDPGFRDLLEFIDPRYQLPCRQTLTNRIVPGIFENCKIATADILSKVNYIALTVDGWSSASQDAYLGLVGHYIDENWKMQKILIDLIHVRSISEDAETIAQEVKKVCEELRIFNKIVCIVTDEAAPMIAAVVNELKKIHIPCFCHVLNTIIRNAITKGLEGEKGSDTKAFSDLFSKNRAIVSFFHRSNKAQRIFNEVQREELEDGELLKNKFVQMVGVYFHFFKYICTCRFCSLYNVGIYGISFFKG